MERFYRHMRLRHHVLVSETGKPAGGQWNFRAPLGKNNRLNMVYLQLKRMDLPALAALQQQATDTRARLADL